MQRMRGERGKVLRAGGRLKGPGERPGRSGVASGDEGAWGRHFCLRRGEESSLPRDARGAYILPRVAVFFVWQCERSCAACGSERRVPEPDTQLLVFGA